MIQKLRYKFIGISTAALIVVLITIIGSMVAISSLRDQHEADTILTVLVKNKGQLSSEHANQIAKNNLAPHFNQEDMFQYRYFSAVLNKNNQPKKVDNSHIFTVSQDEISNLAKKVKARPNDKGMIRYHGISYAYRIERLKNGTAAITFLDVSMITRGTQNLMMSGVMLGLVALILFEIVLISFSGRAIKPIIVAEKRQKEFITNAGHELKTPLAIISANNEMTTMLNGESEWTKSTDQQVKRMTNLITQMVSLAKLEEQPTAQLRPTKISDVVNQSVTSFKPVIEQNQHQLHVAIEPNLRINADPNYLHELVNILLDNANKYCDDHGSISVTLKPERHAKSVVLSVANDYAAGQDTDFQKFFERFYRDDQSHHHGKKGGFGIGLSMAQKIVQGFHGRLSANWQNGQVIFSAHFKTIK